MENPVYDYGKPIITIEGVFVKVPKPGSCVCVVEDNKVNTPNGPVQVPKHLQQTLSLSKGLPIHRHFYKNDGVFSGGEKAVFVVYIRIRKNLETGEVRLMVDYREPALKMKANYKERFPKKSDVVTRVQERNEKITKNDTERIIMHESGPPTVLLPNKYTLLTSGGVIVFAIVDSEDNPTDFFVCFTPHPRKGQMGFQEKGVYKFTPNPRKNA